MMKKVFLTILITAIFSLIGVSLFSQTSTSTLSGDVTTTSLTLQNVAGLTVSLSANSIYEFEGFIKINNNITYGNSLGINYSASGATIKGIWYSQSANSSGEISLFNTPFTIFQRNGNSTVFVKAVIITGGSAGNLTIQQCTNKKNGSTVMSSGTYFKVINKSTLVYATGSTGSTGSIGSTGTTSNTGSTGNTGATGTP